MSLREFHLDRWETTEKRYRRFRSVANVFWVVAVFGWVGIIGSILSCNRASEDARSEAGITFLCSAAIFLIASFAATAITLLIDVAVHAARSAQANEEYLYARMRRESRE